MITSLGFFVLENSWSLLEEGINNTLPPHPLTVHTPEVLLLATAQERDRTASLRQSLHGRRGTCFHPGILVPISIPTPKVPRLC